MQEDESKYFVATRDEIQPGERVIAEINGREVAVFNVNGELQALANYCTHQGGPLCEGTVSGALSVDEDYELVYSQEDEIVSCPWHGWEFEISSGDHLANTKYQIPTYNVVIDDDGRVYVEM